MTWEPIDIVNLALLITLAVCLYAHLRNGHDE